MADGLQPRNGASGFILHTQKYRPPIVGLNRVVRKPFHEGSTGHTRCCISQPSKAR